MAGLAEEIPFLSRCLAATDIELLELANGREVIRLRRDSSGQISTGLDHHPGPKREPEKDAGEIMAPCAGIFRRTHPLRTAPLVQAGQQVAAGDPVGMLQIGALLVHVVAPKDGIVSAVLAEDGALAGYGTALVRLTGAGKP
jgi:acetyl-CoA carboxylase biotin carboxyl carrier protein